MTAADDSAALHANKTGLLPLIQASRKSRTAELLPFNWEAPNAVDRSCMHACRSILRRLLETNSTGIITKKHVQSGVMLWHDELDGEWLNTEGS